MTKVAHSTQRVCVALAAYIFGFSTTNAIAENANSTIRVTSPAAPATLGNPFGGIGPPSSLYWGAIYEGLSAFTPDGDLVPRLAQSWTNVTPTSWQFSLRPDVVFHNGEPLDAEAVAGTLDYLLTGDGKTTIVGGELSGLTSVDIIDAMTIEIKTDAPDPLLLHRLTLVPILPALAWESRGLDGFTQEPIGSGPFRLSSWGTGNARASLEKWPKHHLSSSMVDNVIISATPDASARLQALLSGSADIALGLNIDDIGILEQAGVSHRSVPLPQVMSVALRTERPDISPLSDTRVRQALNYAVDRETITKVIFNDLVQPASQGAIPGVTGFNPNLDAYPYDPERAKTLLAEAGYQDGFRLIIELITVSGTSQIVFQKVAADLLAIGVAVELRTTPFSSWLGRYVSGAWGDVDGFSLAWNSGTFNDALRPIKIFSCLKPNPFFCEPSLTPKINDAEQEFDPHRRRAMLHSIQTRMKELAPAIMIAPMPYVIGHASHIEGFDAIGTDVRFETVKISRN